MAADNRSTTIILDKVHRKVLDFQIRKIQELLERDKQNHFLDPTEPPVLSEVCSLLRRAVEVVSKQDMETTFKALESTEIFSDKLFILDSVPLNPTAEDSVPLNPTAEGVRLYKLAGKPTKEELILVYGEKGPKMTWAERAKAGIPAEEFRAMLSAARYKVQGEGA